MSEPARTGAFALLRAHWNAFLVLNLIFFGVFAASMTATLIMPELQEQALTRAREALASSPIGQMVLDAYHGSKNLGLAIALTFAINVLVGALLTMTIPSLIVPFSGFLMMLYRALEWGFLFAPTDTGAKGTLFTPHGITLLIEGEAYVLTAFAAFVHARMLFKPAAYGEASHWAGYKAGVSATLSLYKLIIVALLVAAIYEGYEVIYLAPKTG